MNGIDDKTIRDFGTQWSAWRDNDGYYASPELFEDMVGALVDVVELKGKTVADIGSGTGRIVHMLLDAGAGEVTAVEPSDAFGVLKTNTAARADRIHYVHGTAADLTDHDHFDWIFSIGVIHHIADPGPTLRTCHKCLAPSGRIVLWLYGHEGNELYLALVRPLRAVTKRLPHWALVLLCWMLDPVLAFYIFLCRHMPLPARGYMTRVIGKFAPNQRRLVIYDQLNPAYAKYYRKDEAMALLQDAGFRNIRIHHRHGYSWTVMGEK